MTITILSCTFLIFSFPLIIFLFHFYCHMICFHFLCPPLFFMCSQFSLLLNLLSLLFSFHSSFPAFISILFPSLSVVTLFRLFFMLLPVMTFAPVFYLLLFSTFSHLLCRTCRSQSRQGTRWSDYTNDLRWRIGEVENVIKSLSMSILTFFFLSIRIFVSHHPFLSHSSLIIPYKIFNYSTVFRFIFPFLFPGLVFLFMVQFLVLIVVVLPSFFFFCLFSGLQQKLNIFTYIILSFFRFFLARLPLPYCLVVSLFPLSSYFFLFPLNSPFLFANSCPPFLPSMAFLYPLFSFLSSHTFPFLLFVFSFLFPLAFPSILLPSFPSSFSLQLGLRLLFPFLPFRFLTTVYKTFKTSTFTI